MIANRSGMRSPAHVFDGKAIASQILLDIKGKLEGFVDKPCLAVVSVGERKDIDSFVRSKLRGLSKKKEEEEEEEEKKSLSHHRKKTEAEVCGIDVLVKRFDKLIGEQDLLEQVALLNSNAGIDGIVLQLPLPSHLNELTICQAIDNEKDVDSLHKQNLGMTICSLNDFFFFFYD